MTQKSDVLLHLQSGKSISPMEAYRQYGITCLAERCRDLRDDGYPIISQWEKSNGKRYVRYSLTQKRVKK